MFKLGHRSQRFIYLLKYFFPSAFLCYTSERFLLQLMQGKMKCCWWGRMRCASLPFTWLPPSGHFLMDLMVTVFPVSRMTASLCITLCWFHAKTLYFFCRANTWPSKGRGGGGGQHTWGFTYIFFICLKGKRDLYNLSLRWHFSIPVRYRSLSLTSTCPQTHFVADPFNEICLKLTSFF